MGGGAGIAGGDGMAGGEGMSGTGTSIVPSPSVVAVGNSGDGSTDVVAGAVVSVVVTVVVVVVVVSSLPESSPPHAVASAPAVIAAASANNAEWAIPREVMPVPAFAKEPDCLPGQRGLTDDAPAKKPAT